MAGSSSPKYYRNRTNADTTTYQQQGSLICCTIEATGFTNPGYKFVEWNGNRAGTSISYHPGDTLAEGSEVYAIWVVANDITVTKNTTSGSERWDIQYTADQAGTIDKTLLTAGKLMDRNEKVSITIPSGSATTPTTSITLGSKSININSSTGLITATMSGSGSITPTVSAGYVSSGTSGTVSASGTYTTQLSTQAGTTISPTESEQTAVAAGKYTLGAVKVGAISSTYIGSGITQRSSSDLTASGATVTVPAGHYSSNASKSVASGSVTAPTAITGEATAGAAGTLAMANPQIRLVELTQSVSVTPNVTTAGYISSGTAGTSTIKTYAQIAGVLNNTFTPTTTDQTIASNGTGFYLVGTAKVAGDANLVAGNIKKDVPIFGVTGTYEGAAELPPANGVDF